MEIKDLKLKKGEFFMVALEGGDGTPKQSEGVSTFESAEHLQEWLNDKLVEVGETIYVARRIGKISPKVEIRE